MFIVNEEVFIMCFHAIGIMPIIFYNPFFINLIFSTNLFVAEARV